MSFEQIEKLLTQLHTRFGWNLIKENGNIIGAELEGQTVTLEPGGQLELSGAPVDTLFRTCAEVNSHLYQVSGIQLPVLC
jgi:glutamate--cysteine ligase